jgi:predicted metal-dependent hydrolase
MTVQIDNLTYKIYYRKIRNPRLEFKTGKLVAIVPYGYDTDLLINKYKDWIIKKSGYFENCINLANKKELSGRTFEEFKKLVDSVLEEKKDRIGGKISSLKYRKMKSRWASVNFKKNSSTVNFPARNFWTRNFKVIDSPISNSYPAVMLTLNKQMKYLPDYLIEYIIFHEIAHLSEKNHGKKFRAIIKGQYKNYRDLDKELYIYCLKISSIL